MIEQLRYDILTGIWAMMPEHYHSSLPLFLSVLQGKNIPSGIDEKTNQKIHNPYCLEIASQVSSSFLSNLENENNQEVKKVMIIPVQGMITKNYNYYGGFGTKLLAKFLQDAYNDSEVVGVVLDMDSGGGLSNAPEIFCEVIRQKEKPVITLVRGVCGSAAYRIAAATDEIHITQDSDVLGSVGTMFPFVNDLAYYEKMGVKIEDIYSDLSPQKNNWYRKLMAGGKDAKKALLDELLNPHAQNFIDAVKADRGNKINKKYEKDIFEGATYMGEENLKAGLADQRGNMQQAIEKVVELSQDYKTQNNTNMSKSKFPSIAKFLSFSTDASDEEQEKGFTELEAAIKATDTLKVQLAAKTTEVDQLTADLKVKGDQVTAANQKASDLEAKVAALTGKNIALQAKLEADPETVSVAESVKKGGEDVSTDPAEKQPWEKTEWAAEAKTIKEKADRFSGFEL